MPGTAFSELNWDGYDEQSVTNPVSALTDFTLLIDVSTLSATWKSNVQSDGADIRLTKGDNTELPYALLEWNYNAGSPTGVIAVKWTGTLATSGTQNVRVWSGYTGGTATAYDATETYGSDNAFDANHLAFYHFSSATDWTGNGHNLTGGGSPSFGGISGEVGSAWDTLGTSWAYASSGIHGNTDLTVVSWLKLQTTTGSEWICDSGDGANGGFQILKLSGSSTARIRIDDNGSNLVTADTAANALGTLLWKQLATRVDKSADADHRVNSADSGTPASVTALGDITATQNYAVAAANSAGSSPVDAHFGLHAIHNTVRYDAWLDEFNALRDQATFWGTWAWKSVVFAAIPAASIGSSAPEPSVKLASELPTGSIVSSGENLQAEHVSAIPTAAIISAAPEVSTLNVVGQIAVAEIAGTAPDLSANVTPNLPVESIAASGPVPESKQTPELAVASIAVTDPAAQPQITPQILAALLTSTGPAPGTKIDSLPPVASIAASAPTPGSEQSHDVPVASFAASAPNLTSDKAFDIATAQIAASSPVIDSLLEVVLSIEALAANAPGLSPQTTAEIAVASLNSDAPDIESLQVAAIVVDAITASAPEISDEKALRAEIAVAEITLSEPSIEPQQAVDLVTAAIASTSPALDVNRVAALVAASITSDAPAPGWIVLHGLDSGTIGTLAPVPGTELTNAPDAAEIAGTSPPPRGVKTAHIPSGSIATSAPVPGTNIAAHLTAEQLTAIATFISSVGGNFAVRISRNSRLVILGVAAMGIQPGAVWDFTWITRNKSNDQPTDADSLPTVELLRNGVSSGEAVTVTKLATGHYLGRVTIPTDWNEGDDLDAVASWAVASVADKDLVARERIDIDVGVGAFPVALTIKEGDDDLIPNCDVIVTTTSTAIDQDVIAAGLSDANGEITFYLDAGTYYVWRQKAGIDFGSTNPRNLTVSSDGTVSVS